MRFMVPRTHAHRLARHVLLRLSPYVRPLRRFVNSGKLSEPFVYGNSPLVESGGERLDVPALGFVVLAPREIEAPRTPVPVEVRRGDEPSFVVVRPDGHVAARTDDPWRLSELLERTAGGAVRAGERIAA
jgi:hypothetical protein